MAYDAAKAHEYYIKYRKKGLKKGRKKGSGTKSSTKSLVGVSTAGLNSDGKIEAALVKEKIKAEMNEALKKATTDAERDQIRREYSKKAVAEMNRLKSDPKYAKPQTVKAPKAPKSSSSRSSGNSKPSGSSRSSGSSNSGTKTSPAITAMQKSVDTLTTLMTGLSEKIAKMTDDQKIETKTLISDILSEIQKQMGGTADLTSLKEQLEKKFATSTSTDVKV